jgi:hypothetical protein
MAIFVATTNPNDLLKKIKLAIKEGHVDTWECDGDGDFTHSVPQWKNKA